MKKPPQSRIPRELIALRKELNLSMDKMAKALGYNTASSYQYYESEAYTKDFVDQNFISRLKKLIPLGISEDRINALSSPGHATAKIYKLDDDLMRRCTIAIMQAAEEMNVDLSLDKGVSAVTELYNHVLQYRHKKPDIQPDEAMAALILKATA